MRRRGYTLLEVLVATVIMATAVVALLSNLSTSLSNAARLTDYDRAVLIGERVMNELLLSEDLPKMSVLEGQWDPDEVGIVGGWRAQVTPFERRRGAGAGQLGLDRLELEVWWESGSNRRSMALEAYRTAQVRPEDMDFAPMVQ